MRNECDIEIKSFVFGALEALQMIVRERHREREPFCVCLFSKLLPTTKTFQL